jgi:hypothetical protein
VQAPPVSEIASPESPIAAAPEIHSPVEVSAPPEVSPAIENYAGGEPARPVEPVFLPDPVPVTLDEARPEIDLDIPADLPAAGEPHPAGKAVEAGPVFNLDSLPPEEQELHRRAFRVAKVSMQDIRMLRPEDVRLGRENKDLCSRLRDDIEKAHKEYDRRFQPIQSHPVDYFYDWMVEILGGGDPQALGEYPYPSPVLRR